MADIKNLFNSRTPSSRASTRPSFKDALGLVETVSVALDGGSDALDGVDTKAIAKRINTIQSAHKSKDPKLQPDLEFQLVAFAMLDRLVKVEAVARHNKDLGRDSSKLETYASGLAGDLEKLFEHREGAYVTAIDGYTYSDMVRLEIGVLRDLLVDYRNPRIVDNVRQSVADYLNDIGLVDAFGIKQTTFRAEDITVEVDGELDPALTTKELAPFVAKSVKEVGLSQFLDALLLIMNLYGAGQKSLNSLTVFGLTITEVAEVEKEYLEISPPAEPELPVSRYGTAANVIPMSRTKNPGDPSGRGRAV